LRIPAKHQAKVARPLRIAGVSMQFREDGADRPSHAGLSRASGPAVIDTFT
jgi:hypothetical protein